MAAEIKRDPDLEWLDHVQPVGLVVAPVLLNELGLAPTRQTQADSALVADYIGEDVTESALRDAWSFVEQVLGWEARYVAGAPAGPPLDDRLSVRLPEHNTTLTPTWAVKELGGGDRSWQLLVRMEPAGVDPDDRTAQSGWEASAHQRFERLLRETGINAGVLISERNDREDGEDRFLPELRLLYAPKGETSGHISFPLRELRTVAGRPMLGGLKLILDTFRLFNDDEPRRLPALLKKSREAQAAVSTALAEQVLGALHELLRGLDAAIPKLIRELALKRPEHLYEGLLTFLMRLVFILYAEDRDLLPSRSDGRAREIYESSYSLRGLYARLSEDAALNPDTMDERRGSWGRLLALFKLIHKGHPSHFVQARGGKLFESDQFPFLEGRVAVTDPPVVPAVSDGCVLRILEGLMTLAAKGGTRERLSYRTLDVEQIGSVYETVMGFTVETIGGRALAIKAGKHNRTPVFVDLEKLASVKGKERIKFLKEEADRTGQLSANVAKAVEAANDATELAAALDPIVDERGSPKKREIGAGMPILQPTKERRRTGTHYTPRSLTEPIVRYALEPVFDRLGPAATPEKILDLKVCDPAMGSGAFLVEACRTLAAKLVGAWSRYPDKKPVIPPDEDEELHARRLVAQRCLYGVDKNPLAADLAKLSLWLATLARDHEFTFLDHALKSGDSLVGLTQPQIVAAHWDTSKPGLPLFRQLVKDRVAEAMKGRAEIQAAPDDTSRTIQEQRHRSLESRLKDIRLTGDAVIAAFFAEDKPKARERKRAEVESWLTGSTEAALSSLATMVASSRQSAQAFHWPLEFPEVFARENGGFDTIVGNPPFLGGKKISSDFGGGYRDWLLSLHESSHGNCDLVAHFFRRSFNLIRRDGTFGLIATNTIGQGDTRASGLAYILGHGGTIKRAVRRQKWPGDAAVTVSIIHVCKSKSKEAFLDDRLVHRVSAYLVEGDSDTSPSPLISNSGKAFQGSIVLGIGFTFDDEAAAKGLATSLQDMGSLIEKNPRNADRIFPYIGGDEINSNAHLMHSRHIIDFADMTESQARKDWPDLVAIVERLVRPDRQKQKREDLRNRWWQFAYRKSALYQTIVTLPHVLVRSLTSAHFAAFALQDSKKVFDQTLIVFCVEQLSPLAALASRAHELWVVRMGATLEDRGRYNIEDCFETFPFPSQIDSLEKIGRAYNDHRAAIMVTHNEGMTKTYNRFHDRSETEESIRRLRELHATMDRAVLEAYGWHDLAARAAPVFLDETNEDDHTYQGRLFWPSDFRDEVLARLLALNAERHAEEVRLGIAPESKNDKDEPEAE
jgi:hypothetical protein